MRGLSQGGEVHFNGIKVGDVKKIALDPADPRQVIARIRVTSDVPIRQDSYATLEPQGITGVNFIQITAGTTSKPLLKDVSPPGQVPRIPSKKDAFSDLLAGGSAIVGKALETLNRVNQVLSDKNIKSVGGTLSNVEAVTAELREHKSIIADAQHTLQTADQAMVQFRELGKSTNALVNGDGKRSVAKLGDAAGQLEGGIKEVRDLLSKLQDPTVDFARTGLPQVTASLVSLQKATDHLNDLLSEIQVNPRRPGRQGTAQANRGEAMIRVRVLAPLFAAWLLAGCISVFPKEAPAQLYRFGGTATVGAQSATSTAPKFAVQRLVTSFDRAASNDRILAITGEEAAYLKGVRWVTTAPAMFDAAVTQALRIPDNGSALLVSWGEAVRPEYLMKIDVRTFEVRYDHGVTAPPTIVVEFYAALSVPGAKVLAGERTFSAAVPATENRGYAIAAAFDQAVGQTVRQAGGLGRRQRATPPPRAG